LVKLATIRDWLWTHRKQVLIHSLIVSGFLVYCFLLANPLFDRFEAIAGEATLQKISLPDETNNIRCQIEWRFVGNDTIQPNGWAFIEGKSSKNTEIYFVLESKTHTYVFDTIPTHRPDVTAYFKDLGLDLSLSGFTSSIPMRKIKNGEYAVGVYLRKGGIEALQFLDSAILKSSNDVRTIVRTSRERIISLPLQSGNLMFDIGSIQDLVLDNNKVIEISGFSFIKGHNSVNSNIYIVLSSGKRNYVFDTIFQRRPDVTAYFEEYGLNLDASGFVARIPKEKVESGNYRLGTYIKKEQMEALQYTHITIDF